MPFDWRGLADLAPFAIGALNPGSPEAAAMMQGYLHSQEQIRQAGRQRQHDTLLQQQYERQNALAQAQIANLTADNARADQAASRADQTALLQRLTAFDQYSGQRAGQLAETAQPQSPDAQNQLAVDLLSRSQAMGLPPSVMGGQLPNMPQMVSKGAKADAASILDHLSKYVPAADQTDEKISVGWGELTPRLQQALIDRGHPTAAHPETGQIAPVKPSQLRGLLGVGASPTSGAPWQPSQPTKPAASETERLGQLLDRIDAAKAAGDDKTVATLLRQYQNTLTATKALGVERHAATVVINPAAQSAIEDQAQQLVDGNLVPSQLSKRAASYNEILAAANRKSREQTGSPINFVKLQSQFSAAQRHAASMNGAQAIRFRGLAGSVVNTIDEVQRLADELKQGSVQLFNRAKRGSVLQVYGNTPQSQAAAQYLGAINTLKEEFAGLIQGGYAPTESAFHLANQQINADYGVKDLSASLTEVQRLINYRLQAFEGLTPLGAGGEPRPQTPIAPFGGPHVEEWVRDPATGGLIRKTSR